MFATIASRLAIWLAIFVGAFAGGTLALMDASTLRATPKAEPLQPALVKTASPMLSRAIATSKPHDVSNQARELPARTSPQASAQDLTPSPHDSPLADLAALSKSERLCIRDIAEECVRVADVYRNGKLTQVDKKRASQYQNLAFKAYIRGCESNKPEACYALARMYLEGDSVPANPVYAKNLMRRVVEVCRYRDAEICRRLKAEAPVPPKAKHHN